MCYDDIYSFYALNIIICGSSGYIGSRLHFHLSKILTVEDKLICFGRDGFYLSDHIGLSKDKVQRITNSGQKNILIYSVSTQIPGLNSFSSFGSIYEEVSTLQYILNNICELVHLSYIYLISSAGAFAYQQSPRTPDFISEETSLNISSSYALTTKLKEDLFTQISVTYSVPMSILRLSNVFGPPFIKNRSQGLINKLISSSFLRKSVHINVPLTLKKNVLFIDDFCTIFTKLLCLHLNGVAIPKQLLVCSSNDITISEIIQTINTALDHISKSRPLINYSIPVDNKYMDIHPTFDNTLLLTTLSDFSFTPFLSSIEKSINEYLLQASNNRIEQ